VPLARERMLAHMVRAPARIEDLEEPDQDEQEDAHGRYEFDQHEAALVRDCEPPLRPPLNHSGSCCAPAMPPHLIAGHCLFVV